MEAVTPQCPTLTSKLLLSKKERLGWGNLTAVMGWQCRLFFFPLHSYSSCQVCLASCLQTPLSMIKSLMHTFSWLIALLQQLLMTECMYSFSLANSPTLISSTWSYTIHTNIWEWRLNALLEPHEVYYIFHELQECFCWTRVRGHEEWRTYDHLLHQWNHWVSQNDGSQPL